MPGRGVACLRLKWLLRLIVQVRCGDFSRIGQLGGTDLPSADAQPLHFRLSPIAEGFRAYACHLPRLLIGTSIGVALVVPFEAAQAQLGIAPPSRNELLPPEREDPRDSNITLTIDGDLERAPCALDRPEYSDFRFTLSDAQFEGAQRAPEVDLTDTFAGYAGRELPLSVLCDIRAAANSALRSAGYLASVEIPEQNLSDGVPDFRIVFGRLTALRVRGDAGPSEELVERYLRKLTDEDAFNTNQAERYLLLADDLPGVDVRLSLRPAAGGAPGDLIGEIAVVRQRGSAGVSFQNLGSKAIGRFGGLLRSELYDLTGLGDRTTVAVYSTLDFDEQQTVQLGHDFRVGGEGLRFGVGLTYSETDPSLGLEPLDVRSETVIASAFASYPVQRTRQSNVFADFGFDLVDQDVEISGVPLTRDRLRTIYVRLSGDWTDFNSVQRIDGYSPFEPKLRFRYSIEARQGLDMFSSSPDCRPNPLGCVVGGAPPPARIEADPTSFVLRYDGGLEYRPDPLLTFVLDASAQATSSPLPAFEEFAAGSFSIGRGYDPGAVLGDNGIGGTFELRYGSLAPKEVDALAIQPFVFTDVAFVWNEDRSRRALNPDRLWSAGGGLRAAWGSRVQADFALAQPLVTPDFATERGDLRFQFTLTARLFPWRY